jgi:hypothetical protein
MKAGQRAPELSPRSCASIIRCFRLPERIQGRDPLEELEYQGISRVRMLDQSWKELADRFGSRISMTEAIESGFQVDRIPLYVTGLCALFHQVATPGLPRDAEVTVATSRIIDTEGTVNDVGRRDEAFGE